MIIGHLPIGYLVTKLAASKYKDRVVNVNFFMAAGMVGCIGPDLDMFYFYFIDNHQHHHHTYWTHIPLFWAIMLMILSVAIRIADYKALTHVMIAFGVNVFLHLAADTIVGDIWWLLPIVNKPFALFTVPTVYHPWWLNFIIHWSFCVEILITASAIYTWLHRKSFLIL
jgi:inner membrane protein